MAFAQRRLIMRPFVTSRFPNFPIVWIFHSPKLNERINRIHESLLRTIRKYFKRNRDI